MTTNRVVKDTQLLDPKFITLVGTPANRRAFSVVRSDSEQGETQMSKQSTAVPARRTRVRRSDAGEALVRVAFPAGVDQEAAITALGTYGLKADTFTVEADDAGVVVATRSDMKSISNDELSAIPLDTAGTVVFVKRSADAVKATEDKSHIAVVSLQFDAEKFSDEQITEFLQRNDIDIPAEKIDTSSGEVITAVRSDTPEGAEVRSVQLEDGVIANVIRADQQDVPAGFVQVISETAYSGWGWGQLDFNATLADVEVGEKIRRGIGTIQDLLWDILLWSPLPIEARKELVTRSLTQFGDYVTELLDTLPRDLLIAVSNTAQRSDKVEETTKMNTTTPATPNAAAEDEISVKRSELNQMIDTRVAEAMAAQSQPADTTATTEAQRSDATATPEAAAAADTATITRGDAKALFAEVLAPISAQLQQLAGTTVVRSDASDAKTAEELKAEAAAEAARVAEVKRTDPFKGALRLKR